MLSIKKIACALSFALIGGFAQADECPSCGASNASESLSLASSKVLSGSIDVSAAAGSIVIESVSAVAETLVIVSKGSAEVASVTVQLSGKGIQQLGLVSGAVLKISAISTGHLLISAGKAIAFIPNEIGKALIHQEKIQ